MSFLEVNNIEKSYGKTKVLKGISFDVKKGEVLATCYTNKEGVADILKEVHDAFEITSQLVSSLEVIHSYLR